MGWDLSAGQARVKFCHHISASQRISAAVQQRREWEGMWSRNFGKKTPGWQADTKIAHLALADIPAVVAVADRQDRNATTTSSSELHAPSGEQRQPDAIQLEFLTRNCETGASVLSSAPCMPADAFASRCSAANAALIIYPSSFRPWRGTIDGARSS